MPRYILESGQEVPLAPRPLRIVAVAAAPGEVPVVLGGHSPSGGATDLITLPERRDALVVRSLPGSVTITAAPGGSGTFPAGARLTVTVTVEDGSPDPVSISVDGLDVSGLRDVAILSAQPHEQGTLLRIEETGASEGLSELGEASRVIATELLGRPSLEPAAAVDLLILVDASASFDLVAESARALLHVLSGVAVVMAPQQRRRDVALLGLEPQTAGYSSLASLGDEVIAQRADSPPSSGFRSAPQRLHAWVSENPVQLFILTDGVPADIDRWSDPGYRGRPPHLVVIGEGHTVDSLDTGGLPRTTLSADVDGSDPSDNLLAQPSLLRALVSSLLIGHVAQTTRGF